MRIPLDLRRVTLALIGALVVVSAAANPVEAAAEVTITGGAVAERQAVLDVRYLIFDKAPDITITGGTPLERDTVLDAWQLIFDRFPHLRGCLSNPMPGVVIRPSDHVGIYDFRIETIILRSGGFHLADAVHEMAHHLDWQCGFDSADEDGLFAATGLARRLRDSEWAYRPVEIFAEAVVKLVLGPDASSVGGRVSGLHPGPEVQDFVARWGGEGVPAPVGGHRTGFSLLQF